jgi:LysR family hydrogen peroxide-inducible transcriptional activator
VPRSDNIRLLDFEGEDRPSRRIAMAWRRSSAMTGFLEQLAEQFKRLPEALFMLDPADGAPDRPQPLQARA